MRGRALIIALASLVSVASVAACRETDGGAPGAGDSGAADGSAGAGSFGAPDAGDTGVDGDGCGLPATRIPALTGLTEVRGVVVIGDSVLVAHAGGVTKCSARETVKVCTATTFPEPPRAIAAAGAAVVVAHGSVIERCELSFMKGGDRTGCAPIQSAPEVAGADALAVTGAGRVHFTSGGTLFSAGFGGALEGSVATGLARGNRLSSDGTRVFFTAAGAVRALEVDGGVTEILAAPQADGAEDVFAFGDRVCITTGAATGTVLECDVAGCAGKGTMVRATGRRRPYHVTRNESAVLFTDAVEGTLSLAGVGGAEPATAIAACLGHPRHVAATRPFDGRIFLAVDGPGGDTATADVVEIFAPPVETP